MNYEEITSTVTRACALLKKDDLRKYVEKQHGVRMGDVIEHATGQQGVVYDVHPSGPFMVQYFKGSTHNGYPLRGSEFKVICLSDSKPIPVAVDGPDPDNDEYGPPQIPGQRGEEFLED